jgi:S1-C subfamily serine protease
MLATLYLVHAGKFPAAHVSQKHQKVCLVVEVDPSGDAHAGGLETGDVWVQVDATELLGKTDDDPCVALTAATKATAVGAKVKFVVFRGGARTELLVNKTSDRMKFVAIPVPVLDADKT